MTQGKRKKMFYDYERNRLPLMYDRCGDKAGEPPEENREMSGHKMKRKRVGRALLSVVLLSLLVGCGVSIQTAPPEKKSQEKRNREKREKTTAKGKLPATQRTYKVMNKWYTPLHTSEGYLVKGIASWYGKKFHGRKTSNGEIYNMHAMTAAHKTLPLGTYVKVTRIDNGESATVRINDRGPFVRGRIIDLSYQAAKKIDLVARGTTPVIVEALGEKRGNTYVAKDYRIGSFTVQVGAFIVESNAQRLMGRLKNEHGHATIQRYDTGAEIFYRVRVGSYTTLDAAQKGRDEFDRRGFTSPFVVAEQ